MHTADETPDFGDDEEVEFEDSPPRVAQTIPAEEEEAPPGPPPFWKKPKGYVPAPIPPPPPEESDAAESPPDVEPMQEEVSQPVVTPRREGWASMSSTPRVDPSQLPVPEDEEESPRRQDGRTSGIARIRATTATARADATI